MDAAAGRRVFEERAMDGIPALAAREAWAASQFATTDLGDRRRSQRLVQLATQMAGNSSGSIPQQTGSAAALKAAYRLFDADDVTHAAVCAPHWAQTRRLAGERPLVFLVQDTCELNFTSHAPCEGLGPIGRGEMRGLHQQNVLAVDPQTRRALGLLYQQHHRWTARPADHDRRAQHAVPLAERASHWWIEALETVGRPPAGVRWVHVGDRAEDVFGVYAAARATGTDWLIRALADRCVTTPAGAARLFDYARRLPGRATRTIEFHCRQQKQRRQAELHIAAGAVTLQPSQCEPAYRAAAPIACQVLRVWEPAPPAGVEGLEWLLLTTLPCETADELAFASQGYALRWTIEEFHKCEKTGCRVEMRRLEDTARLEPLIGLLSVLAVWLLQLKHAVEDAPEAPAAEQFDPPTVAVMAAYLRTNATRLKLRDFWRGIGLLGGHMGRKCDGKLGWLRAWRGWQAFQLILLGADLARQTGG
jgi:hypothetical protein